MKLGDLDFVQALREQRREILRMRDKSPKDYMTFMWEGRPMGELIFAKEAFSPAFAASYKEAIAQALVGLIEAGLVEIDAQLKRLGVEP